MPSQEKSKRRAEHEKRPYAKRSRVSRACDQCRVAREKCDGDQPVCLTCTACKRACTYTAAPKKRGIQPGYIRTLELSLAWLFQNTGSEALLNQKLDQDGSVLIGREGKLSSKLHKTWRRSRFCKDVDRLLSGQPITGMYDDHAGSGSELEEELSPDNHLPNPHAQKEVRPALSVPQPNMHASATPIETLSPRNTNLATTTPLPQNSWHLLDIYFAFTQSWLPICERPDILKLSYSYPDRGLPLSANMVKSGNHAELWSIFAVASHQSMPDQSEAMASTQTEILYRVARSLIPDERGLYGIGHVKALVNLAVVELGRANPTASWLLASSASRILFTLEQTSQPLGPRRKHIFAACYLLDMLLSFQLSRRPYLERSDLEPCIPVEEDGLEDWQPWSSPIHPSIPGARAPLLSLSSFNKLMDLVDILGESDRPASTSVSRQQLRAKYETWKASLPEKLVHVCSQHKDTPWNPPAVLLRLGYLCSTFTICPSQSVITQMLDLLEEYQERFGAGTLPPIVHCLLQRLQWSEAYSTLDAGSQLRLDNIRAGMTNAWRASTGEASTATATVDDPGRLEAAHNRIFLSQSTQVPFASLVAQAKDGPDTRNGQRGVSSFIDDLPPDINTSTATHQRSADPIQAGRVSPQREFVPPSLYQHQSISSREIESFFDELASLDGTERLENQPQFMQNLGFAPDANMPDFLGAELSQYLPMTVATFLPQNNDPTQFDPALFEAG